MDLTHFDKEGRARMVDISQKDDTERVAIARGRIYMSKQALTAILDKRVEKGNVFGVARVAGIMAVKETSRVIPMSHLILITSSEVEFEVDEEASYIEAQVKVKNRGKTGVEMEALHGCTVSLLTIYDMVKAIDRSMVISDIRLEYKSGGKSGVFTRGD